MRRNLGRGKLAAIYFDAVGRVAVECYLALVHDNHAVAEIHVLFGAVTHKENGFVLLALLRHTIEAFLQESYISNGENFVDNQDIGIDSGGHRKGQPDIHA